MKASAKNHGSRRRNIIILVIVFCILWACGYYIISSTQNTQKNAIRDNASVYAVTMDERISTDLHGFMELNLNPELESAVLSQFFYSGRTNSSSVSLDEIQMNAIESVEMTENLDGLILYRTFDHTLLSTLSTYSRLAKINPAYSYLMNTIAQVDGDEPTFVYGSDGSVLYYYPMPTSTASDSGEISDCVIAVLHKSDGFLNVDFPIASSLASFSILKGGQVLSTEGYNALSQNLVANIAEIAKSHDSVYTYSDLNLPDYYFYIVPSQVSELNYCYYEPALTGWPLIQEAIAAKWWLCIIMLLIIILTISFLVTTAPSKKTENRVVSITTATGTESTFGSLPYYSGIIIDYHNMNGEPVSPEILNLFDQIICENLSVNKILYQVSSQHHSDCLQYYINYTNYNMRVLSDSLKMNLYNAAPDYAINIFYSATVPTYQEMETELLYLHRHLRYSLVFGYGMRLSIEQIKGFEESSATLDMNVASTIQNHLRTRAYDDLYAYLRRCRDTLAHSTRPHGTRYSFTEIYRFLEEAFSVVKLFFQENSFAHPLVQTSCISVLRSRPGFRHFCDYLINSISDYQHENQHVLSTRNEQIMNSIYMYIEQDLAGANLNSIAHKMQMTDSHLSRVFKKNTGTNFSEYLSERKLEEAAKLLTQDNKLKVADIADMLGYGNPTYFLSRFKAKYGVSPSAYRKAQIIETAKEKDSE